MVTAEQLSENSRQAFKAQKPTCVGLESDLSRNLRWGWGHIYDETPVDIAVYVRNDPVNMIDPDGKMGIWFNTYAWYLINDFGQKLQVPIGSYYLGLPTSSPVHGISLLESDDRKLPSATKFQLSPAFGKVKSLAEHTDCADFIKDLYGKVSSTGGALYDHLLSTLEKGPWNGAVIVKKDSISPLQTGKGIIPASTALSMGAYPITLWKPFFDLSPDQQTLTLLHEEVHVGGYGVSDQKIAEQYGWKYDVSKTYDENTLDASAFWDKKLTSACK